MIRNSHDYFTCTPSQKKCVVSAPILPLWENFVSYAKKTPPLSFWKVLENWVSTSSFEPLNLMQQPMSHVSPFPRCDPFSQFGGRGAPKRWEKGEKTHSAIFLAMTKKRP